MTRLRLWLRSLVSRRRLEREMQEELAEHVARAAEHFRSRGMSREAAEREARRQFGNLDLVRDHARDARGGRAVESLIADLRYGYRQCLRQPVAAVTMIAVLSLGIGFTTALVLVIRALVSGVSPGVTADPSLVRIRGGLRNSSFGGTIGREFSYPEYRDYAAESRLFRAVAAWTSSDASLDVGSGDDGLHSGAASFVSANYFQVLGVRPVAGTGLPVDAAEDTGTPDLVAVISYVVWDRYYGRAGDVIGRALKVNGVPVTIVGVAPRRFNGARTGGSQVRVWLPLSARAVVQRTSRQSLLDYDTAPFGLVARLQPGTDLVATQSVVQAIADRASSRRSAHTGAWSTDVVELTGDNYFPPSGRGPDPGRPWVVVLLPVTVPLLILAITGTTVSSLQAGLAIARRREIGLRLALGASRRRIVRQLLTESMCLALAAAALGLLVIWVLLWTFESAIPDVQVTITGSDVALTGGLALVTGVLVGLSPALHATRLALWDLLKDAAGTLSPARSRLQAGLVVAQIALTQPALFVMGALIVEIVRGLHEMPGAAHADRIVDARFNTNPRYGRIDAAREETLARVASRLAEVPGVAVVVSQEDNDDYVELAVDPDDQVQGPDGTAGLGVRVHAAPAGYFEAMSMPVVRGHTFIPAPTDGEDALVIGVQLARRFWGEADPIGRRLMAVEGGPRRSRQFSVVGVVDDSTGATAPNEWRVFVQTVGVTGRFLIRTHGPAAPIIPMIRSVAIREAPELPLVSVTTLSAIEEGQRRTFLNAAAATGTAGAVALFLSAIGLYAVVAVAVVQRTREIGIRAALGANRRRILGMFIRRGLTLGVMGLVVGLAFTVVATLAMQASVGDRPPEAGGAIAVLVAVVVLGVALVATWIPARRAATVDPLQALRTE